MKRRSVRIGNLFMQVIFVYVIGFILFCKVWGANDLLLVDSYFSPEVMTEGEAGNYCIEISGRRVQGNLNMPKVDGIQILGTHQEVSSEFINGNFKTRNILKYSIVISKEGSYTVPAFNFKMGGQEYRVPEAKVMVVKPQENKILKLECLLNKQRYYVGEVVPLNVLMKWGKFHRLQEATKPDIENLENFSRPKFNDATDKDVDTSNEAYSQVVWKGYMTALKIGTERISFRLTALISKMGQGESDFPSLFNMMSMSQQPVLLKTEERTVEIVALPEEGKSSDFSGGVGGFRIKKPTVSDLECKEGDPVTVIYTIEGKGNFERIQGIKLASSDKWKIYSPKRVFKSANNSEIEGELKFEYVFIPQTKGTLSLPKASFNYFDLDKGKYVELNFEELSEILVKEGEVPVPIASESKKEAVIQENKGDGLVPIKLKIENFGFGKNILISPIFLSIQMCIAITFFWLIKRDRRRLRELKDPNYVNSIAMKQRMKKEWHKIQIAMKEKNGENFYSSLQTIIQWAVNRRWSEVSKVSTLEEIFEVLKLQRMGDEVLDSMDHLVKSTMMFKFGKNNISKMQMSEDFQRLEHLVRVLGL